MKEKSARNRTLVLSGGEESKYLSRCVRVENLNGVPLDKTVFGDTFAAMKRLPKGFADLVIVDPPYNLSKDFHGNKFNATGFDEYVKYTESWLENLLPLIKENGTLYVCCDWKSSMAIGNVLAKKMRVLNRITWEREKGRGAKANWKNSMEDIWFAVKGDEYKFNLEAVKVKKTVIAPYKESGVPKDWTEDESGRFRFTCPSNFWADISVPYWSMPENTDHPTQKPEKLIAKLILASSDEGDVVFDPFLGSGTTSVTAKKLNRHYVGIEQNGLYCAWAEKRLEAATADTHIQGYENGVFLDRNALNTRREK